MLKKYKKRANMIGIGILIGLVGVLIGSVLEDSGYINAGPIIGLSVLFCGTILYFLGCWFYAKGKGYNGAWGLFLGIFSLIGLIVLAALPDKYKNGVNSGDIA